MSGMGDAIYDILTAPGEGVVVFGQEEVVKKSREVYSL
jgi:hypothetical protein